MCSSAIWYKAIIIISIYDYKRWYDDLTQHWAEVNYGNPVFIVGFLHTRNSLWSWRANANAKANAKDNGVSIELHYDGLGTI